MLTLTEACRDGGLPWWRRRDLDIWRGLDRKRSAI